MEGWVDDWTFIFFVPCPLAGVLEGGEEEYTISCMKD